MRHTPQSCRLFLASVFVYGLGWFVLCAPWLGGEYTIPYDAKAHFQAQLQFLATALHTGQSPFWTPNVFGGSPQIADPQSLIFSPAFLIAYFNAQPGIGDVDAYALGLVGCGGLALMAMFRDRGWHPAGGMIAGLAFAFGASAAWRIQHIGQIQSYALFAIALWTLARALDRRSVAWGVAAGLSAGLMIVEPDQVALLAGYILAAYTLWHLFADRRPISRMKCLAPALGAASLAGLAVVAIPLVLTFLFVEQSNRPMIDFAEAVRGSLHPASLLTAVIGDIYGAFDPRVEYWGPYSVAWNPDELTLSQNMSQLYDGALPIVLLASLGLTRGMVWDKEIRFFTAALAAMLLYALGGFTPFYHLLYDVVPGVSFFRRPADATFLVGGLLAIVAGYLAHRLLAGAVTPDDKRVRMMDFGTLAFVFALGVSIAVARGHLVESLKPIMTAAALLAAAGGTLWAARRFERSHSLVVLAALAGLMILDLRINNGPNESTALAATRYEFLKPNCSNDTIRLLKSRLRQPAISPRRDRVELVGLGFSWPNVGLIHGFEHVLGYNPLRIDVVTKAVGAGDSIAGWEQRQFTPLFPSYRSLLADMLGLRFIATSVPIEKIDPKLKPGDLVQIARTADAYVYENPRAMPRVVFIGGWQTADFADLVATGKWPAFDPGKTVLLEQEPSGPEPQPGRGILPPTGFATISHYENTIVDIDVTSNAPGFVLVNNVWHPWWRTTVDGQPADYLKANVMFGAVQVPAGRHRVHLEFEPITGAFSEIVRGAGEPRIAIHPKRPSRRPRA